MIENKTVSVRPAYLGKITSVLDRLNKRALKLNVPPVVYTVSAEHLVKVGEGKEEKYVAMVDVSLTLNIPKLADWDFVATIQHSEAGNLLLTVPGKEALDLSFYRTCPPKCVHCNLIRNRADTYLVRHSLTGTLQQVGKQCLADFTGYGTTPEQAADFAEWLSKLVSLLSDSGSSELDGDEGGGSSRGDAFSLDRFLSFVVSCSNRDGFWTRKQAEATQGISTGDCAINDMFPAPGRKSEVIAPTDEEIIFAKQTRAWAAALVAANDFEHNLKVIASGDACLFRNVGIAAYLIQAYRNHLGLVAKKAALPESKHFGAVKSRIRDLKLTYLGSASFDSQYGTTFIHRFRTEDGCDAIWKTGSDLYLGDNKFLVEGATIVVDATVKAHGDYKGRLQTVLTRVAIK